MALTFTAEDQAFIEDTIAAKLVAHGLVLGADIYAKNATVAKDATVAKADKVAEVKVVVDNIEAAGQFDIVETSTVRTDN